MSNKLRVAFVLVFAVLIGSAGVAKLNPENRVIAQIGAPVKIVSYKASYNSGSKYVTKGIHHNLEYENTSGKEIVAIRFGLVSFDVFNRFIDRTGGIDMDEVEPNKTSKGSWVARAYADFSFHTGVVYVDKVRFASGDIWHADVDTIVQDLQKIEEGFDAANLQESDESQ